MVALGAFLAALHIGYHAPSVPMSIPMLFVAFYGLVHSNAWWSLLLQALLGLFLSMILARAMIGSEGWSIIKLLPVAGLEASDAIDFFLSLVSAGAFGFLYEDQRPLDDTVAVREIGALAAVALVLACMAITYLAKQFWFRLRPYEPGMLYVLVEITAFALLLDLVVWGAKAPSRVAAVVVLVLRCLSWVLQRMLHPPITTTSLSTTTH